MSKKKQLDRVRVWNQMPLQFQIYKNMSVTYRDFFEVLHQLGYIDQSNDTHYKLVPPTGNSGFNIPKTFYDGTLRSLDQEMRPLDFFTHSQTLYLLYEVDAIDDVAKMIEKNREKMQEKLTAEAA